MQRTRVEWKSLSVHLKNRRIALGLSQGALAQACGIKQSYLSHIELGKRKPTLDQLAAFAERLDVPLQWFINGKVQPGYAPEDIALELRALGISDLLASKVKVPGAFRTPEEVLILSLRGDEVDPRVLEAVPFILVNRKWDRWLLYAYARKYDARALVRLGWLIDIAFIIREKLPHQVDPVSDSVLEWIRKQAWDKRSKHTDGMGFPTEKPASLPAVHRRWKISYATTLSGFIERAKALGEAGRYG
ncbi:MAG: helix-turn-helix transcriptional regulator [Planctomycetia bacterium]|nr:helix-turn-helix transcriptional regulator [Planctomycetia bacterium]